MNDNSKKSNDTFAARLTNLLKENRLTVVAAAKKAKISKSTLHNWTVGHVPTDFDGLERLSKVLNTDITFLLLGKSSPQSKNKLPSIAEIFLKDATFFDGFCHVKITRLIPRENVQTNEDDGDDE